jgi:type I restriction enzyme S subunit
MAEKQNTPEIRFEGFTDPWEQRKLGRLFFESNERSSSMEILSVSVARGIYPASESDRDTNPGASLANYKVVHKGDVVYNSMRMWQGAVGSSDYDGIVSPAYVVARPAIELDSTCFGYLLKRPEMLYKYLCDSQGNSKDTQTLKYNRFADIEVTMPANLEEQRVISACLGRVGALITLHQRKYDKLCTVKKSMLDKMFPKPGETEPEIRFEGFTDPWEQRKLGNCGTTYGGLTGKTKEDFGHGSARFIPYTNVFDNPLTDTKRLEAVEIDSSQNQVAYGDVFFTVSSETPDEVGMSSVWLSDQEDVYLNSFCFGYRQDSTFDPHYLAYMLRSSSVRSNLTLLAQGISRFNISKNKVMELNVPVPSAVEQKQLGQYFTKLDNLITLHQRKLDLLKNTKKSLLDKMFV